MIKLNRNQKFATIRGETPDNARFMQGGIRFKADGTPCEGQQSPKPAKTEQKETPPTIAEEKAGAETAPSPVPAEPGDVPEPESQPEPEPESNSEGVDYSAMKAPQLRDLVVEAGGEYTNKAEAIAFLEALEA